MNRNLKSGIGCILFFLLSCAVFAQSQTSLDLKQTDYIGRYNLKPDLVLEVTQDGEHLKLLPSFWGSAIVFNPIGKDKFESLLRPRMKFEFKRDPKGQVVELVSTGNRELNGVARRLPRGDSKAVEFLLAGKAGKAKAKLDQPSEKVSEARIVKLGFNLLRFRPSQAKCALEFLSSFESQYPNSADLQQLIGLASLMSKNRQNALNAFRKAAAIEPGDSMSASAIRLLDPNKAAPTPKDSWKLPFDIDKLFEQPSEEEIEKVRADWKNRDLRTKDVTVEHKSEMQLGGRKYQIRVFSHTVQNRKHYGAVLVPDGAKRGNSPVVLELHGVNARYSPFDIAKVKTPRLFGENRSHPIIAVPSFRGNTLVLEDKTFVSEGSPADAWDGAADDAIAFLNLITSKVPEADTGRISAFGKSRGGTVALLVGVRDKRIRSVVNWAGPSGWFSNMGTFGWSLKEQVRWGLWEKWKPGRGWG
ncbi:MAG: hypothetical protein HKN25_01920, partial [Pyrinomonadaceae bacterium]|nr:hypothetical protein [Pyrinomonadaceae bacterium]